MPEVATNLTDGAEWLSAIFAKVGPIGILMIILLVHVVVFTIVGQAAYKKYMEDKESRYARKNQ